jgi:hypothetical protein
MNFVGRKKGGYGQSAIGWAKNNGNPTDHNGIRAQNGAEKGNY